MADVDLKEVEPPPPLRGGDDEKTHHGVVSSAGQEAAEVPEGGAKESPEGEEEEDASTEGDPEPAPEPAPVHAAGSRRALRPATGKEITLTVHLAKWGEPGLVVLSSALPKGPIVGPRKMTLQEIAAGLEGMVSGFRLDVEKFRLEEEAKQKKRAARKTAKSRTVTAPAGSSPNAAAPLNTPVSATTAVPPAAPVPAAQAKLF